MEFCGKVMKIQTQNMSRYLNDKSFSIDFISTETLEDQNHLYWTPTTGEDNDNDNNHSSDSFL
jgi:hypothetical protein